VGLNLDLRIGTSRLWQLQVLNPDDSVPTGQFLSADVLSAIVWQGAADVPILSKAAPDVAWISATNAQFSIAFHPSDTVNLGQGVYYIEASATRGADVADLLPEASTLTLTATPGLTTPRATYVTIADLKKTAAWIQDIQAPGNETGFLEQCADARDWLDECILRNYRGGNESLLGAHGVALDGWFTGGARRSSLRNIYILNLLKGGPAAAPSTGGLILTSRAKDICAYYALHRVMEGMITRGGQYPALSSRMLAKAHQLLTCWTAELNVAGAVDYGGNLIASIPVNFSSANVLWS
jgi:hypothetical protein